MSKTSSIAGFMKDVYNDDFKWSIVKSIGIFALGVTIAKECQGMELFVPTP